MASASDSAPRRKRFRDLLASVGATADPRFAADERHQTALAARPTLAVLAVATAVSLVATVATRPASPLVIGISLFQVGLAVTGLRFLSTFRTRRRTLLIFFALLVALQGPVLTIALDPVLGPTTLGYLTLIPVAVAVFLPWSTGVHLLWLVGLAISTVELVVLLGRQTGWPIAGDDVIGPIVVSGFVSLAGNVATRRRRQESFANFQHSRSLRRFVMRDNRRLGTRADRSDAQARQDPLTGVANRLALEEDIAARAARPTGASGGVLMIDIDHFKAINDLLGHAAGDQVLRAVAVAISISLRPEDRVYRVGGEEFLVILDGAGAATLIRVAERIRLAIRGLALPNRGNLPSGLVTVSIGVAESSAPSLDVESADVALYEAKRTGRDRIVAWAPGMLSPTQAGTDLAGA